MKKIFVLGVILGFAVSVPGAPRFTLNVADKDSLATAGDFVHTEITPAGQKIATKFYALLNDVDLKKKSKELKNIARECSAFDSSQIANRESIAMGYLAEQLSVPEKQRKFAHPLEKAYFEFFTENNCSRLKTYLIAQYKLSGYESMDPEQLMNSLNLYQNALIYNSPYRTRWEPVAQILKLCALKKGEAVIDYGCRQGYYSQLFRNAVGDSGMVYSLDNDRGHIDFLQKFIVQNDIPNMLATKSTDASMGLVSNKADVIFINQMYHFIYIYAPRVQQRQLLLSMRKTLRKGGRLIIIDNNPVKGISGYSLHPDLIIGQLKYYDFELKKKQQLTSSVYFLEFVNNKEK